MTPGGRARLVGCGLVLAAIVLTACSEAVASDPPSPAPAASTTAASHLDARGQRYKESLTDAGIPPLPDDTLMALANGICGQLSRGTDAAAILAHLTPMAQFASATSEKGLTTEQVARVYLDAAEANYC
ncbi:MULTISPECIES: DUF732 domain-containing protein [unclassified Rhodococcus (in: high G+C Gram-positive bacteria)]|uniref:DUF732 domain-containing protein n=1 Tax=unclassified Rhodococcus (in: high G+C Gram-positive bacteria) TaxID=192944 RepID=UPI00163954A0|nr:MULTISPECIES: DUF732 domain-containing protein [unclassified Rhodococcus (in: high G+C Gram-positive bacteria)]MBC2638431.1 DUF732 domain-containing protein [Rhodococcus sp. 3A]MBC2896828.1 DUF732 domain-containing protein [Rhodococcus sp. 4CII]